MHAGERAGTSTSTGTSTGKLSVRLRNSQSLQEIFELVQEAVWKVLRVDQAGLMVGLVDLGISPQGVLGAFYSPDANTIVMNRTVMNHVKKLADQILYNSYCFYILLHEYLHSCGYYDENENRSIVSAVAKECFGPDHAVSRLANQPDAMLKLLQASIGAGNVFTHRISSHAELEFVSGIDRRNTNYIM